MRDCTPIQDLQLYIDQHRVQAGQTWFSPLGQVWITLIHPTKGQMQVLAQDLHKYTQPQVAAQPTQPLLQPA